MKVGNGVYSAAQVKGLGYTFENSDKLAAYTGLGYDTSFFKEYGFSISTDFGVFWNYANTVKITGAAALSGAAKAAEEALLKTKFDRVPVSPIVSVAAKYRF